MDDTPPKSSISISIGGDNSGTIMAGNVIKQLTAAGLTSEPDAALNETKLRLYRVLADGFNLEELRTLCFEMGIDYEDMGGEGKSALARELVQHESRHGRLPQLESRLRSLRPSAFQ